jgi:hypothetical protein
MKILMINLTLVKNQPRWRVALVARFAQMMGVLIHVEGIPFGSNRTRIHQAQESMGPQAFPNSGRPDGNVKVVVGSN